MLIVLLAVCAGMYNNRCCCLQVPMGGPETNQLEGLQFAWEACLKMQLELQARLADCNGAIGGVDVPADEAQS